jgi:hypothetical protein
MRHYDFIQTCKSRGDLRVHDVVAFMKLMRDAFEPGPWMGPEDRLIDETFESVERELRLSESPARLARFGGSLVAKGWCHGDAIVVMISVGGDEWTPNRFVLDFTRTTHLPDLSYFRRSIELLRPSEAYISDAANDDEIRELQERGSAARRSDLPIVLRWFHYFDASMVEKLGGVKHCLRTPGFSIERFCDGMLFQLAAGPLDVNNPAHKEAQLLAMEYLGLMRH